MNQAEPARSHDLMTVGEVADYLRCTVHGVYGMRKRMAAPGSLGFLVGRRLLFRRGDLDMWIEKRAAEAVRGS